MYDLNKELIIHLIFNYLYTITDDVYNVSLSDLPRLLFILGKLNVYGYVSAYSHEEQKIEGVHQLNKQYRLT